MRRVWIGAIAAAVLSWTPRAAHAWSCWDYYDDTPWPQHPGTIGTDCPLVFFTDSGFYEPDTLRAVYYEDDEPIEIPLEAVRNEITLTKWWGKCWDCENYEEWRTEVPYHYYELHPAEPLPADREIRLVHLHESGPYVSPHVRWRTGDENASCVASEDITGPWCYDAPCEQDYDCRGWNGPDPAPEDEGSSSGCSAGGDAAPWQLLFAFVIALAAARPGRRARRSRA